MRVIRKVWLLAVCLYGIQVSNVTAADQDKIIEGAKKEGTLVVYTSMTVDQMQKILTAFKARYPFIQATMFRAVGERLLTKIMTEAQTGKYDFDVVQSAESQAYFLKKKNLLQKYISPETKNIQKPFFDPEGLLDRRLHHAQRHRIQHAHAETQRGTEDRRGAVKPKVEEQDRYGPYKTGVVRLESLSKWGRKEA